MYKVIHLKLFIDRIGLLESFFVFVVNAEHKIVCEKVCYPAHSSLVDCILFQNILILKGIKCLQKQPDFLTFWISLMANLKRDVITFKELHLIEIP